MATSWLSQEQKAQLKDTADKMSAPAKGFLASDESAGPWLRAGHVEAKKIEDTAENRAAYRSMLFNTPGLSEYISGVILRAGTSFQIFVIAALGATWRRARAAAPAARSECCRAAEILLHGQEPL